MPNLTLAQAMEWFGTDDAELNRRANAVRRYEADEQAGRVLAAEIRRRDGETCETCRKWSLARDIMTAGHIDSGDCAVLLTVTSSTFGCRAWQRVSELEAELRETERMLGAVLPTPSDASGTHGADADWNRVAPSGGDSGQHSDGVDIDRLLDWAEGWGDIPQDERELVLDVLAELTALRQQLASREAALREIRDRLIEWLGDDDQGIWEVIPVVNDCYDRAAQEVGR